MIKGFAMRKIGQVGWIEKESITPCGELDAILTPVALAPCTSDIHTAFDGGIGERVDMFLGHESVGKIVEVGKLVKDFKVGDIVIVPAITPNWASINAQRGYHMHSGGPLSGWKFSNFKDGVFAERYHVNEADANLAHLPDGVEATDAVMLCDMVTTGFHAAELAEIKPGERVAVIGLGPVGLMAMAGANLMGASEIYGVDCVPFRHKIARENYGQTHEIDFTKAPFYEQILGLTKGAGVDKVLIAGGGITAIGDATKCVVNGGVISNVDYLGKGETINIPRVSWNVGMGHKTIKGGLTPGGRYRMETLARLLQTKKLNVKPIITHRLEGFDKIEEALNWMKNKPENFIKPVIKVL
ncbi:MAG: NAD(P)-dependent alcohol dehydrogenase [Helicobacter sp.]|nr:NAD(P)-dependent alcohol dehydrogenase [Helicobacter sp.]